MKKIIYLFILNGIFHFGVVYAGETEGDSVDQVALVAVYSSALRWTVPFVVYSGSLSDFEVDKLSNSRFKFALDRAKEMNEVAHSPTLIKLNKPELKLFYTRLININNRLMTEKSEEGCDSVAEVFVMLENGQSYSAFMSPTTLSDYQVGVMQLVLQNADSSVACVRALVSLGRTIQSIAELNRERGFYLGP